MTDLRASFLDIRLQDFHCLFHLFERLILVLNSRIDPS